MKELVIAQQDEQEVGRIAHALPQALILVAEAGLDSKAVVDRITTSTPSQLLKIMPGDTKKTISVDQIRSLILNVRTHSPVRRIVHIYPAGTMTEEAQNALLKILEEPATTLHLLLEATSLDGLLPTIISRCQVVTLHRTSPTQDKKFLEASSLDSQAKQQVMFLGAGRPALIRQMIQNPELLEEYRTLAADAKSIISGTPYDALRAIQRHSASRDSALQLVDIVLTILRFGAKRQGVDRQSAHRIAAAQATEESLRTNGNVKLALLQLVAR